MRMTGSTFERVPKNLVCKEKATRFFVKKVLFKIMNEILYLCIKVFIKQKKQQSCILK